MDDDSQRSQPFDFGKLISQAEEGTLDFLVAYTSDGKVVDYTGGEEEETIVDLRSGPSDHAATKIKFIASSSVYWYCDGTHWWKCRVRNGVERCKKKGRCDD